MLQFQSQIPRGGASFVSMVGANFEVKFAANISRHNFFLFLLEFVLVLVWFGFSRFFVCFPSGHFNSNVTGPFLANSGSTHEWHVILPSFGIVQKDFVNELVTNPTLSLAEPISLSPK